MNSKPLWKFALLFVLAPAIGISLMLLPGQTQAQGGDVGAQAAVGTAFTYQGRLVYNGSAVNGTCDLTFKLYNVDSGSTPVGSVNKSSVSVSDGYFSVALDFGANAFTGDARWLEITINSCPGGASGVTLSPRVELKPAPYALSLRPGATVQGSDTAGSILKAINTDTTGTGAGLYGESQSSGGAGVSGFNTASEGGVAVYGNSSASTGTPYGVYGLASDAGSATSYGVYGKSNSSSGTGVGGVAPWNGVYGEASATSGTNWGVYGKSNSSGGYGVYGTAPITGVMGIATNSINGTGVYGTGSYRGVYGISDSYAVYGLANGNTGTPIGVYGEASGTTGANRGGEFVSHSASGYGVWARNMAAGIAVRADSNGGTVLSLEQNDETSGNLIEGWANNNGYVFRVQNNGDVRADGTYYGANFTTGSADFAEMVLPGQADLRPGDVLVVGPDGRMAASTEPYQTSVVGVYSTQPGFIAGRQLDDQGNPLEPERIPLAVVGIVPVKVSAENGPIRPGDLLTTSGTPGHAMKAGNAPPVGSVIGKALEALPDGVQQGVIQMLVMLQ